MILALTVIEARKTTDLAADDDRGLLRQRRATDDTMVELGEQVIEHRDEILEQRCLQCRVEIVSIEALMSDRDGHAAREPVLEEPHRALEIGDRAEIIDRHPVHRSEPRRVGDAVEQIGHLVIVGRGRALDARGAAARVALERARQLAEIVGSRAIEVLEETLVLPKMYSDGSPRYCDENAVGWVAPMLIAPTASPSRCTPRMSSSVGASRLARLLQRSVWIIPLTWFAHSGETR